MATERDRQISAPPPSGYVIRSKSAMTAPSNINIHQTSLSSMSSKDRSYSLSPNITTQNSLQRRSAIHTSYGKSPVSLSPDDGQSIKFDYNVFVTTWQDQIKMRQYEKCEKYCREVIEKLLAAEDQQQLMNAFGGVLNSNSNKSNKSKKSRQTKPQRPTKSSSTSSDELEDGDEELHTLLEYRSKVHFSLAYLLKKYFKRYDEARKQYEESIKTDKENPGAHFNLANMLVDHYKDYTTAEYHFKKAIKLEPTYALYRMTYAEFLWHDCNRYKDSANQYEELIKYYSNNYDEKHQNEDIYFNYGLLLRDHLDDVNKSIVQFKRVLEINPTDNEAKEELNYTLTLLKTKNGGKKNKSKKPKESDDGNISSEPEPDPMMEQPPVNMKVSITESEHKNQDSDYLNKMDLNGLLGDDNNNEVVAELDTNMTRKDYQKNRKKGSSFRRSQHEIVLPQLLGDDEDGEYAMKYHQVLDEKNKLKLLLKQKQLQQSNMNENLRKLKDLLKESDNDGLNFRNQLNMMVQNGPNYVESNSKQAHKLFNICKDIVTQLDTIHISKNEDSAPVTPVPSINGISKSVSHSYSHQNQVSDSDFQYQSRLRNSSVI